MENNLERITFATEQADSPTVARVNTRDAQKSGSRGSIAKVSVHEADIELASNSDDDDGVSVKDIDLKKRQVFTGWQLFWLAYQSIGVIYGDIGTSPLYVYSSTFSDVPSKDDLLGVVSIIIWTLTLIVTVKYVFLVLRADDEGEGGTFAIYSLLSRYSNIATRDPKTKSLLQLARYNTNELRPSGRGLRQFIESSRAISLFLRAVAVFGVALVMADGVLTPAQSVLGAIQGITVQNPNLSTGTVVGVTCAILVLLFVMQPLGIHKLGSAFAPIVILWLLFNFVFGIYNLAVHDASILKAFSPYYAGLYFVKNKTDGWRSLGGILLAFTGVEALFADLGAFSMRAIQLSWLCFTYPCLLLAYIGQAAYMMDDPTAYTNPFFNTVPPGMFWPSLILSVLAAIVASQAIITGTFQLLQQVTNMSFFPPIKMIYTSKTHHGQVYIPVANWLLMIGTVVVTAVYNNTTRLGNAYGVCVILVTFITTNMVTFVAILVWRLPALLVLLVWLPFITLDGLYLSSVMTKVPDGAWFTLMLAVVIASVFILWRWGKEQQWKAEAREEMPFSKLVAKNSAGVEHMHATYGGGEITTIKGLGIYFDKKGEHVPSVYAQFLQKFEARPEVHVFLHIRAVGVPTIPEEDRYSVADVQTISNCYRVTARHGYNEEIVSKELGSVVYQQVRRYIMEKARRRNIEATSSAIEGESSSSARPTPSNRSGEAQSSTIQERDAATAAALSALDRAYSVQTVYIVGKEQLRIIDPVGMKWYSYFGTNLFRRGCLEFFLWIRENTRARVAALRVPVQKLVEVGFVIPIH